MPRSAHAAKCDQWLCRTDHQRRYKPGREKRIQQDHLYELPQHHLHDERCAGNRPTGQQQRGPPTGTGPHRPALSPRDEQIEKVLLEDNLSVEEKVVKLIKKCNARGGTDNISIAYLVRERNDWA